MLGRLRAALNDKAIDAEVALVQASRVSPRRLGRLIRWLEWAIEEAEPRRALQLRCQLQTLLAIRYQMVGSAEDLRRALRLAEKVTAAIAPDHPLYSLAIAGLGTVLTMMYQADGDPAHLDAAIAAGLPLVGGEQPHPALGFSVTSMIANARVFRWEVIGELEDLTSAIEMMRRLVLHSPVDLPDRPAILARLGMALLMWYEMSEDDEHLNEAVASCLEAAQTVGQRHPERPEILTNLAIVLSHGGRQHDGEPALVEASVRASEEAVQTVSAGSPNRVRIINRHVAVLMCAGELLGRRDLLDEAIEAGQAILAELPADHPTRALCLGNVATAARMRFDRSGDAGDAELAVCAWREVTGTARVRPWTRLDAAQKWGLLEGGRGEWDSALAGYRVAIAALPRLAHGGLSRPDQELQLEKRAWIGLASDAAACALHTGNACLAVELLESGRAVIWAQTLAGSSAPEPVSAAGLVAGWAVDGPAIMVNFSRWRGDALVVSRMGIRAVPLPGLVFDDAVDVVFDYLRALTEGDDPGACQRALQDVLAWTWETIAEPVLAALGYDYRGRGPDARPPRVWWCPTNIFSLVPMHAAGYHGPGAALGASVIERVVSSYTPTLRLLSGPEPLGPEPLGPEQPLGPEPLGGQACGPPRLLITAVPAAPCLPTLALSEVEKLASLFPGERHTLLDGEAATRDRVRADLARHEYVHFGCHGQQDLAHPSAGGLRLYDGVLTIAELTAGPRPPGELAFLAACQTAAGGLVNSDEAISLAAALRFAGWRDVIGSLWAAPDTSAAEVATAVFTTVADPARRTSDQIARALHRVTLDRRNRAYSHPLLWAPFLHLGR
jgi:hypothetical protein